MCGQYCGAGAAAHAYLLEQAPNHFEVQDFSKQLAATPGCEHAHELECYVFCLTLKASE